MTEGEAGERRRARRDRLADRALLALGGAVCLPVWAVAWFGYMRVGTSTAVRLALLGVALAVTGAVLLRRRLYPRVGPTRLLALGLGLGLPLAAVELVANLTNPGGYLVFAEGQRYFYWQRYEGILQDHAHPPLGQLTFPWGTVTTNAEGWRSPPLTLAPAPGTLRVLALGDSFCFSWGVDDSLTVCAEVERDLRGRTALAGWSRVEVVNTGNGSNCGIDELLTLEERGLAYAPHAVFLLVCSNDFTDRPAWTDQVDALDRFVAADPAAAATLRATARPRPAPLAPASEPARSLFGWVSYAINRSFWVVLASGRAALRTRPEPAAPPAPVPAPPPPPVDLAAVYPYLAEGTAAVREIVAICAERGLPLTVLVITPGPVERQLTDHLRGAVAGRAPVLALEWPPDPARYVNSASDGHWNPLGTRYFGGRIAEALVDRLPAPPR